MSEAQATPGRASDPQRAALESLRLDGAIFFRSEFTEDWSYESPSASEIANLLRPGAQRLILFHIVAEGRCWITVGEGERHWADAGDVIVLPYGDLHVVGGVHDSVSVPIATLIAPPPWATMPVVTHGGGGERTGIVCGYLHSADPLFDPRLRAFPPVFVVRPLPGPAAEFVQAAITWALANTAGYSPSAPVDTRLPELLLTEVLRLHLESTPASGHGWLAALRDPVLAPALAQLHAAPAERWTVRELASSAAVSRSLLDQRFRMVLGLSPIRYLTEWRMHLARELLATTDLSVFAIARRIGYESEEAFSRAFKRATGQPPSTWRAARTRGALVTKAN